MALTYGKILAQAAARIGDGGSIVGTTTSEIESSYTNASFGSAQIDNPRFPFEVQKDALLLAEERMISVIAANRNSPYRSRLSVYSANLANRAALPIADTNGNARIGVLGNFKDATDGTILTEKGIEEVERLLRLRSSGAIRQNYYHYAIEGGRIVHTRTNVNAEMVIYNRDTQKTAINDDTATLLPDTFEEMYVCGQISFAYAGDEAPDTANQYVQYFADGLARLEKLGAI